MYNWQFVHCIDFWSIVLARACDVRSNAEGSDNELKALIYPLVQVSLGSIKYVVSLNHAGASANHPSRFLVITDSYPAVVAIPSTFTLFGRSCV